MTLTAERLTRGVQRTSGKPPIVLSSTPTVLDPWDGCRHQSSHPIVPPPPRPFPCPSPRLPFFQQCVPLYFSLNFYFSSLLLSFDSHDNHEDREAAPRSQRNSGRWEGVGVLLIQGQGDPSCPDGHCGSSLSVTRPWDPAGVPTPSLPTDRSPVTRSSSYPPVRPVTGPSPAPTFWEPQFVSSLATPSSDPH